MNALNDSNQPAVGFSSPHGHNLSSSLSFSPSESFQKRAGGAGCTAGTSALQFFWFLLAKCAVGTEGEPNNWDPNPWASLWASWAASSPLNHLQGISWGCASSPEPPWGLLLGRGIRNLKFLSPAALWGAVWLGSPLREQLGCGCVHVGSWHLAVLIQLLGLRGVSYTRDLIWCFDLYLNKVPLRAGEGLQCRSIGQADKAGLELGCTRAPRQPLSCYLTQSGEQQRKLFGGVGAKRPNPVAAFQHVVCPWESCRVEQPPGEQPGGFMLSLGVIFGICWRWARGR